MSDKTLRIALPLLILLLAGALVIQAFAGRERRHAICESQNTTLQVLHDVIEVATTPPPGRKLTVAQVKAITSFQTKTFTLINAAEKHC